MEEMTDKPMTVGDVRTAIKDLPDDMPIYLETGDYPTYFECLNIDQKDIQLDFEYDEEDIKDNGIIKALCFDYT